MLLSVSFHSIHKSRALEYRHLHVQVTVLPWSTMKMGKKYIFSFSLKLVDTQMLIDSMRAKHCGSLYSHAEEILFHRKNRTERFITKHRRHFFAKWSSLTKQCLPTEETFNKLNANLPVASLLWSFSRTSSILDISLSTFCFASSNVDEVEVDMINVKTSGV